MAHLLLFDLPGGNDFAVLDEACALGHQVTLVTSDRDHYFRQGEAARASLAQAREVLEVPGMAQTVLEEKVLQCARKLPLDAVLCLVDIRLIAASRMAERLGLPFLQVEAAQRLRDKVQVREALARAGLRQPAFGTAGTADELRAEVLRIGFPVLVKPADGYGSQGVHLLESVAALETLCSAMASEAPLDYGLGVRASQRLSVEQYIDGDMIGCDLLVNREGHVLVGINDKRMFPPPSFSIRGSCFPSVRFDTAAIEAYALALLDAVGFDFGACHIEMIVNADGPWLVEINPRLVSAQIPWQMAYALGRSMYEALIDLHLGRSLRDWHAQPPAGFCAIRWLTAERPGVFAGIQWPQDIDPAIRRVVVFKNAGEPVRPPLDNGDRIAYVMAFGESQRAAELAAEQYLAQCILYI